MRNVIALAALLLASQAFADVTGIVTPGAGASITGGACTNQFASAIAASTGVPTCATVTSAAVDTSIAKTGTDINTSNQVTALHLASSVWASRGSGSYTGQRMLMTDIGAAPGTEMQWDGTFWKVMGDVTIYADFTQTNGTTSGSNQVVKQFSIPTGLVRAGRFIRFRALFGKSGATDAYTSVQLRVGTAGTTSDTSFTAASGANTVRSIGLSTGFFFSSATVVNQLGVPLGTGEGFNGTNSTSVPHNITNTVSNIDSNPVFCSAAVQLASTTDTPQVWDMIVEIVP